MELRKYHYTRPETGVIEEVAVEPWQWEAQYEDNTTLKQYGDDGIYHQIREIRIDKAFRLHVFSIFIGDPDFTMLVPPGGQVTFIYRVCKDQNNQLVGKICLFSYYQTLEGNNGDVIERSSWVAILPNGKIVITEDKDSVNF